MLFWAETREPKNTHTSEQPVQTRKYTQSSGQNHALKMGRQPAAEKFFFVSSRISSNYLRPINATQCCTRTDSVKILTTLTFLLHNICIYQSPNRSIRSITKLWVHTLLEKNWIKDKQHKNLSFTLVLKGKKKRKECFVVFKAEKIYRFCRLFPLNEYLLNISMRPQMQKASVLENMHWNVKCIGTDFIAQEKIRVGESKSASEKKASQLSKWAHFYL